MLTCFLVAPQLVEDHAEIVVGLGKAREIEDGATVVIERGLRLSQSGKGARGIVVRDGDAFAALCFFAVEQRQNLAETHQCLGNLPLLV
jgi:hypothetical protein